MPLRITREENAVGDSRPFDGMYDGIRNGGTVTFHALMRSGGEGKLCKYKFDVRGGRLGRNERCNVSVRDGHATLL